MFAPSWLQPFIGSQTDVGALMTYFTNRFLKKSLPRLKSCLCWSPWLQNWVSTYPPACLQLTKSFTNLLKGWSDYIATHLGQGETPASGMWAFWGRTPAIPLHSLCFTVIRASGKVLSQLPTLSITADCLAKARQWLFWKALNYLQNYFVLFSSSCRRWLEEQR